VQSSSDNTTEMATTGSMPIIKVPPKRSLAQVFNLYLLNNGATNAEVKRINETINELVRKAEVKQEDMGDKISMLKKIEHKF